MKYYYPEHLQGYKQVKAEGKTAWDEIHGGEGYDNFSSRAFLETVLPRLEFPVSEPTALEYGCGTGPGACFLAERGFRVDAIDLIPDAIAMAKQIAAERNLNIDFAVGDVCEFPEHGKKYDLVVDSYCLQCIVFDEERKRLFSGVRSRLKPNGYYLVSTAILDREHEEMIGDERVRDSNTGVVYNRYGSGLIDMKTGVALRRFRQDPEEFPDAVRIAEQWYLPERRHLRPGALRAELESAGFKIVHHFDKHAGSLACVLENGIA